MSQLPQGSSQDEKSIPGLLLLICQAPFPMVTTAVMVQGQGQHFPVLQPLMMAGVLWPTLCPALDQVGCKVASCWLCFLHPVEQHGGRSCWCSLLSPFA